MEMRIYYFTATWCQPCKVFGPIMEKISSEVCDVTKLDIEENPASTQAFGVMSVPTVVLVDENDNEIDRRVGAQTFDNTKNWIESYLKESE